MWRDKVEVEGSNLGRSIGFFFFSFQDIVATITPGNRDIWGRRNKLIIRCNFRSFWIVLFREKGFAEGRFPVLLD